MGKSARIFNVMQYERHPAPSRDEDFEPEDMHLPVEERRGRVLLTEQRITTAIDKHRSIKRWAWIRHDKDCFTAEEEKNDATGRKQAGDPKPAHFHIVMSAESAIEIHTLAGWFGIPDSYVDVPKGGRRSFLDCVEYLTHEHPRQQALGKYLYSDEEVHSNFDWRGELDQRAENGDLEGLTARQVMRMKVRTGVWTLDEAFEADPQTQMDDMATLQRLRNEYLRRQPPPSVRVNYYISGKGGVGKGLLARALARSLYPGRRDDEIFFEVGGKNVPFEGYRGQPVLIWADWRAGDFLTEFGGRGRVFQIFEPHPGSPITVNIKGSSVVLTNPVNIVASEPSPKDFLDGLAGEYTDKQGKRHMAEDKGQATRRWPILIPMREDDFDIYLNSGWLDEKDDYREYVGFKTVAGNMRKIRSTLAGNQELVEAIEGRVVEPLVAAHRMVDVAPPAVTDDALHEFSSYGSAVSLDPAEVVRQTLDDAAARARAQDLAAPGIAHCVTVSIYGREVDVDASGALLSHLGTPLAPSEIAALMVPPSVPATAHVGQIVRVSEIPVGY